MTISTTCPPVTWLRESLERHILAIRNSDLTLKPSDQWPGKYILPDESIIPAVFVAGAQMVPSQWTVDGIECVIDEVPDITNPGSISGVVSFERWRVRFTNYGALEGTRMPTSLLEISRRMARAFPNDEVNYTPRTDATYESLTAKILGPYINPPIP